MKSFSDRPARRRAQVAITVFFIVVFLALMWPVYPLFSRIHPWVLGLPFSLAYLLVILVLTFAVLLFFYLWETGKGRGE